MLFDSLESRRLFAAVPSAVLKDGVLTVTGNDDSNTVSVAVARTLASAGSNVVDDGNGAYTVTSATDGTYVVTVDGNVLGKYQAADVSRINIYGLGGRDRISGPTSLVEVVKIAVDGGAAKKQLLTPVNVAPTYIDGGAGSDKLFGGTGNDTYNTTEASARGFKYVNGVPTLIHETLTRGQPDTIIDTLRGDLTVSTMRINSDDVLQGFGNIDLSSAKSAVLNLTFTSHAGGDVTVTTGPVPDSTYVFNK